MRYYCAWIFAVNTMVHILRHGARESALLTKATAFSAIKGDGSAPNRNCISIIQRVEGTFLKRRLETAKLLNYVWLLQYQREKLRCSKSIVSTFITTSRTNAFKCNNLLQSIHALS